MPRRLVLACIAALMLLPTAAGAHGSAAEVDHLDTPTDLAAANIAHALARAGNATTGLPTAWCGDRLTGDDVVHAAQAPAEAVVKVVYAYAADQEDRSATWSDALQGNVSVIQRFLAEQSGGGRAIAFDMGTRCGPGYVDITVVKLPSPRSAYVDDFNAVAADVEHALPPATGPRDLMILADQLNGQGYSYGLGEVLGDNRPGTDNATNRGGLVATLWTRPASTPDATGWWPTGMLHEITHTLGAVQAAAPHATSKGHCTDGWDVMCYADGGTSAAPYSTTACPRVTGAIDQVYDCGRDDYYDPAPAPGSYLATHWNVYRSSFMRACAALGDACGATARTLTPPTSADAPRLSGTAEPGAALTTTMGSWLNAPTGYVVRWQHEVAPGQWADLPGSGPTTTVASSDVGLRLRSVVVATNADGSAVATSAPSANVTVPVPGSSPGTAAAAAPDPAVPPAAGARVPRRLTIALRRRGQATGAVGALVAASGRGLEVRTGATRVRAGAGRWRLRLCASTPEHGVRCVLGRRARSVRGVVRLNETRLLLGAAAMPLRVTATLLDGKARAAARGSVLAR